MWPGEPYHSEFLGWTTITFSPTFLPMSLWVTSTSLPPLFSLSLSLDLQRYYSAQEKLVSACHFSEQILFQLRVGRGLIICNYSVASGSRRYSCIKGFSSICLVIPFCIIICSVICLIILLKVNYFMASSLWPDLLTLTKWESPQLLPWLSLFYNGLGFSLCGFTSVHFVILFYFVMNIWILLLFVCTSILCREFSLSVSVAIHCHIVITR